MKEFNLSEKMKGTKFCKEARGWFFTEDVKEFIKRLKEKTRKEMNGKYHGLICQCCDELAGEKLK